MKKIKDWILIDYDFRKKLPKKDCDIWITRTCFTGERWVQKEKYYADTHNIEWDGTIAFMTAEEGDSEPDPCMDKHVIAIQNVR